MRPRKHVSADQPCDGRMTVAREQQLRSQPFVDPKPSTHRPHGMAPPFIRKQDGSRWPDMFTPDELQNVMHGFGSDETSHEAAPVHLAHTGVVADEDPGNAWVHVQRALS